MLTLRSKRKAKTNSTLSLLYPGQSVSASNAMPSMTTWKFPKIQLKLEYIDPYYFSRPSHYFPKDKFCLQQKPGNSKWYYLKGANVLSRRRGKLVSPPSTRRATNSLGRGRVGALGEEEAESGRRHLAATEKCIFLFPPRF